MFFLSLDALERDRISCFGSDGVTRFLVGDATFDAMLCGKGALVMYRTKGTGEINAGGLQDRDVWKINRKDGYKGGPLEEEPV